MSRHDEAPASENSDSSAKISQQSIFAARREIQILPLAKIVENYIVDIVGATRRPEKYSEELGRWIHVGASPRGTISLDRASRAHAWLNGQSHVTPDNVKAVVHDCLRHRLVLGYEAEAEGVVADDAIRELMGLVAVA